MVDIVKYIVDNVKYFKGGAVEKIEIKEIQMGDSLYKGEQDLRNRILLRPIGLEDGAWEMKDKESFHVVAILDEQVVGCVILHPKGDTTAQLMQMAVESELQGRGIGKKILDFLIDLAKRENLREITCHAQEQAVKFYEQNNYTVFGERFQEAGIWHRHMRLTL